MSVQLNLTGTGTEEEFYNKIAQDSKQALIQLVSEAGHGKALAVGMPIPTVEGWKKMGDIQIGDKVFDENGNICTVITVSQIMYDHEVYEIEFDDGAKIVADKEHLWGTSTRISRLAEYRRKNNILSSGQPLETVKTTEEIKNTLKTHSKNAINHAIKTVKPLTLPNRELPIPPYTLGAWLGDGTKSNGTITINDKEILDRIEKDGYVLRERKSAKTLFNIDGLHTQLRKNNLIKNPHIPKEYLRSSIEQRTELLRGLMDTDGTVSKDHNSVFCVTNERLAHDVSELIHSLGIKHRFVVHDAKLYGRFISKRYRFRFCTTINLFYVKRKQQRVPRITRSTRENRYIVRVKQVESVPVKCIGVDSPSHLFLVGREMIPTHNSSSLRTIIEYCRRIHPDIIFKIFDVAQAWYHCAPVKYRQYVTLDKITKGQVANVDDCVYELGALNDDTRRAFVGTILQLDYNARYKAKMENDGNLKDYPNMVYVFEESNIFFGSFSFRKNDAYSQIFQEFVSVGRNYKMRGFLVCTAEIGEMAPSLRRRSRKIYGRLESDGDLAVVRRKNKDLAAYLTQIPRFHFVYLSDRAYGPVRVPDLVKTVPEDYVVVVPPQPQKRSWWTEFIIGAFIMLMFILYLRGL